MAGYGRGKWQGMGMASGRVWAWQVAGYGRGKWQGMGGASGRVWAGRVAGYGRSKWQGTTQLNSNFPFTIGTSLLTTVTTLRATDRDSTSITYSFSSGNEDGIFRIDGNGVVQVTNSLDRDTTPVYNLAVRATDDSGNFGTTLLRVDITDINDVAPLFGQTQYTAFIAENSPEGTLVLPVLGGLGGPSVRIQAIDADEPNSLNSVVRYSLSGPNAARFNIETSGRVTVARGMSSTLLPRAGQAKL